MFDPTDPLHIASVTMRNRIGVDDVNPITYYWGKTWTNTRHPRPKQKTQFLVT
jgi:hypothetical protein